MKKTRIIIISLIIILCIASVAIAIIFQMTENDYKKAANKEQSTADDIELIKNNFNNIFNNDITGQYENVQKEEEGKDVVYVSAQKVDAALGLCGMWLASRVDYHIFHKLAWPLLGLSLILLLPVMSVVALAIKLDSKGPVFYHQERIGYRRRPFKIHKFRTMVAEAEPNGPQLSSENDMRITHIGRFLRKYRIDEIPQFWNVLKGEMAFVGPRPERAYYIEKIIRVAPYYTLLQQVRPGLTSWGMVKFGYATTVEEMVERSKYDLIYIGNMSLTVDVKILIYTIRTVLTGKGM